MPTVRILESQSGPLVEGFEALAEDCFRNLVVHARMDRWSARRLQDYLACDLVSDLASRELGPDEEEPTVQHARRALRRFVARRRRTRIARRPTGVVAAGVRALGEVVELEPGEVRVLEFALAVQAVPALAAFLDVPGRVPLSTASRTAAIALGLEGKEVRRALGRRSTLVLAGLLEVSRTWQDELSDLLRPAGGLLDLVSTPGVGRDTVLARFLDPTPAPALSRGDYAHLDGQVDLLVRLLSEALRQRARGVNVLLWGPTGTGKTELSRLAAAEAGARLLAAPHRNDEGDAVTPARRIAALALGQRLARDGRSVLVFDEWEDIFEWQRAGLQGAGNHKLWFNGLLEDNAVPTIWVTNSLQRVDPAHLRRFSLAVECVPLGTRHRARVLRRHLPAGGVIPDEAVKALARRLDVSAGQLATAVRTAALLSADGLPDADTIEAVAAPIQRLLGGDVVSRRRSDEQAGYRAEALCASLDVEHLANRVAGWTPAAGGLPILLSGPPGTGKSAFAEYLARRLDRPCLHKRASDLLSMWVGGTEARMKESFEEAARDDAVLVLDEVDSFLRDRAGATRSWEVSQVNELLVQIERCRSVVVCTTNHLEALDRAVARRFPIRVAFRYLEAEGAALLFRSVLGPFAAGELPAHASLAERLEALGPLAPGDFAAVARRVRLLGEERSVTGLLDELAEEVAARPGVRRVGF